MTRRDLCSRCRRLLERGGKWYCFVVGREIPADVHIEKCTGHWPEGRPVEPCGKKERRPL